MTASSLHHPCILGDPQRHGGQNQNWWAPQVGGNATSPCILEDPQRKGDKIGIGCLTPAFWEAHKWAEMLHHPCILGDPQQRGQSQSKKKNKRNKNKKFPMVSLVLPVVLQTGPTALPIRVWPISELHLHRGGIHIWSNLVFIHYWVLLNKLSILSIDTWGENPFFHPLLSQAKFP